MTRRPISRVAVLVVVAMVVVAYTCLRCRLQATPPPPPDVPMPTAARDVPLRAYLDAKLQRPKLLIPRRLLSVEGRPNRVGAAPGVPTLFAGVALALGFVSAGCWLARRRWRPARRLPIAGLVLALLLAGAGVLWADIPGPWGSRQTTPRPPRYLPPDVPPAASAIRLPAYVRLPEKLTLEISEAGDSIQLALPAAEAPRKPIATNDDAQSPPPPGSPP